MGFAATGAPDGALHSLYRELGLIPARAHMYICMYIHMFTYISIDICMYLSIYLSIRTYMHTYIHTYIHTYVHMYIYIYVQFSRALIPVSAPYMGHFAYRV